MIILDTNIISEMMKPLPSTKVKAWMDKQESDDLFITTITIAEISYGLGSLPGGKRRDSLESAFKVTLIEAFKNRILSFDESAAYIYGQLMSNRKSIGKPLSILDGQIAAITHVNAMFIATHNTCDFSDCGLNVIDPFE